MKLMLNAHTAPDTPPAAKKKLKQHVLLRVAELMVRGERFLTLQQAPSPLGTRELMFTAGDPFS